MTQKGIFKLRTNEMDGYAIRRSHPVADVR